MRRNKHHTLELKHPDRDRRRQSRPVPRTHAPALEDFLQPLSPDLPALLTTLEHTEAGGKQGTLQPYQIHIPGSRATD